MRRRAFGVLVLAFAAALAGRSAAQEAITIKRYYPRVGDRVRVSSEEKVISNTVYEVKGNKQEKNETRSKVVVHVTEVRGVAPGSRKPIKARRTYEKAEESTDGKTTRSELHGKTVLIEKQGDKFEFTFEGGGAVTGKAAADLSREFDRKEETDDHVFPDRPVRPGDTWELKKSFLEGVESDGPFAVDKDKASGTGKLVKTFQKGNAVFGAVEIRAVVPLTELRGKTPVKLNPGSTMTLALAGEGCLDGSEPSGTSRTKMHFEIDGTVMGVGLKVKADSDSITKTELLPKK